MLRGRRCPFERLFPKGASLFWSRRPWEDLALLSGDRVLFWCCSHERMASAYADERLVEALSCEAAVRQPAGDPDWLSLIGDRLPPDTLARYLSVV